MTDEKQIAVMNTSDERDHGQEPGTVPSQDSWSKAHDER